MFSVSTFISLVFVNMLTLGCLNWICLLVLVPGILVGGGGVGWAVPHRLFPVSTDPCSRQTV